MAERVLRSPGVTTRELDLSAPGRVRPQGIPAGIIGTAQKGPAFVPVNFATSNDFANLFGATEGKHFGAMAVNEWMRNARSGLYLRVLGVGDGQASDSDGIVTNAGFIVGQDMRDKDRTAASKALSEGQYASTESDGAADGPVPNPYAGAGLPSQLALAETQTGRVGAVGAVEETVLTVDNNFSAPLDYDGIYVILEHSNGDPVDTGTENGPTIIRKVFWLSGQAVGAGGRGVQNTNEVWDGNFKIATIAEAEELHLVDVSGAASRGDVVDALDLAIGAQGFATTKDNAVNFDVTITSSTAGGKGAVNPSSLGSSYGSTIPTDFLTIAQGSTVGADEVIVQDSIFTLTLSNDADALYDGSTITVTDNVGASTVLELDSDTSVTGSNTLVDISGQIQADAATTIQGVVDGLSNMAASENGTDVTITLTGGTGTLPTGALCGDAPGAPAGPVYFLSAEHYADNSSVANDYLGSAYQSGSGKHILRGVLMFPSGVLPGIALQGLSAVDPNDIQTVAYGEYGSGKDQGVASGLGTIASDGEFHIILNGYNNSNYTNVLTGSFETTSPIYFSKVFNTDPTKIQEKGHYLYAHYDVPSNLATFDADTDHAFLRPGANVVTDYSSGVHASGGDYAPTYEDWRDRFSHAFTPWIQSQTLGEAPKKLFRFHMLDAGTAGHGQVKVSIANIQKSTDLRSDYGAFDVQIRASNDTDLDPQILQQFSGVNLNPASDRYIARVIGDQNTFFEFEKAEGKQKLVTEGLYPNSSQYVRVEVNSQVEAGQMEASALPIGFQGKYHLVLDGDSLADGGVSHLDVCEPPLPFRESVSIGAGATKVVDARFYWGTQNQNVSIASEKNKDTGVVSLVDNLTKWYPSLGEHKAWIGDNAGTAATAEGASLDADVYNNNAFSLEKLWIRCLSADTANAVDPTQWQEAVYIRDANANGEVWSGSTTYFKDADGKNKTASTSDSLNSAGYRYLDVAKDFGSTASKKFFKFTVPMQGGWDGLDILDADKASMSTMSAFREMDTNTSSALGGPDGSTTAAFRKALDILSEKSDVDIQLLATPGMRTAGITDYAIDKTEDRFDALYIMDMPAYDHDGNLVLTSSQETSVTNTAQNLANRNLDTSFAATYFPDLVIADGDNNVVSPPSVAVLGALSLNDAVAHPWYAPAGFARGALASTIETAVKLNRSNMDVLYDSDINPITSFPQTGASVIVFGQKTMLQAQSALDRVNVRRLLIDVRRKVRTVSNQVLFEPNREATLARFSALVNPILGRIQQQQGLDRYKVVIDTTTTTQQDVENNTIRGKIFLQPTRSIEFISLDFVVTNAGAEI